MRGSEKEVKLADQLFSLYVDVLGTLSDWKNVLWSDVTKQIGTLCIQLKLFFVLLFIFWFFIYLARAFVDIEID